MTTTTAPAAMRRTHLGRRLGVLAPFLEPGLNRILYGPRLRGPRLMRFGTELIMDVDVRDLDVISDGDKLQKYVEELIKRLGMKAYGPIIIEHFGHQSKVTSGLTVVQLIETSSIVMHLSEGLYTAHINVFSCKDFDPKMAMDFTEETFRATGITYTVLHR